MFNGQEPEKWKFSDNNRPDEPFPVRAVFIVKTPFSQVKSRRKHLKNAPYCVTGGAERSLHERTGLTKQEKTTDIWFDEKDPFIHIRTHNTALKKLPACIQPPLSGDLPVTDADQKRAAWSLILRKAASLSRLTAPYSEERREAAQRYARENNAMTG